MTSTVLPAGVAGGGGTVAAAKATVAAVVKHRIESRRKVIGVPQLSGLRSRTVGYPEMRKNRVVTAGLYAALQLGSVPIQPEQRMDWTIATNKIGRAHV